MNQGRYKPLRAPEEDFRNQNIMVENNAELPGAQQEGGAGNEGGGMKAEGGQGAPAPANVVNLPVQEGGGPPNPLQAEALKQQGLPSASSPQASIDAANARIAQEKAEEAMLAEKNALMQSGKPGASTPPAPAPSQKPGFLGEAEMEGKKLEGEAGALVGRLLKAVRGLFEAHRSGAITTATHLETVAAVKAELPAEHHAAVNEIVGVALATSDAAAKAVQPAKDSASPAGV